MVYSSLMSSVVVAFLIGSLNDSYQPTFAFRWKPVIQARTTPSTHRISALRTIRGGSSSVTTSSNSQIIPTTTSSLNYNATNADPGSMAIQSLYEHLQTSIERGLSQDDVIRRIRQYGKNALQETPRKSTWKLIVEQFEDKLVQILLFVAVLSGIFSLLEVRQTIVESGGNIQVDTIWKSFVEPFVILAILVINATVGVLQSMSAESSLDALQKMQSSYAVVLRDGEYKEIESSQLVPGDIIKVKVGDKIPADSRLLQLSSSSLQVDESSLTGESVTVSKIAGSDGTTSLPNMPVQDQYGMLYSGSMITSGSGTAIVVQTGMDTQMGKIQKGVSDAKDTQPKTPLAIKLDEFGMTLTNIIGFICVVVFLASIPKMNDPSFHNKWEGIIYYAKVAVALGVAAIPEGLPAVITLCLSLGTRRMAQRNVIVRKLPSVETLGCTSVICTDKTGTLTMNEMTVTSLVLLENDSSSMTSILAEHPVDGYSYSPIGIVHGIIPNDEIQSYPYGSVADVAAVSALCNDAQIVGNDQISSEEEASSSYDEELIDEHGNEVRIHRQHNDDGGKRRRGRRNSKKRLKEKLADTEKIFDRVGEPTEAALCVLAEKLGGMSKLHLTNEQIKQMTTHSEGLHLNIPPSQIASANVNEWRIQHPRQATLEFNRDRKSMSVLCSLAGTSNNRLLVKGAPNLLLQRCTYVKYRDGTVIKMTPELRRSIEQKTIELSKRPLRCLALAVKETDYLERSLQTFSSSSNGISENDEQQQAALTKHPLLSDPSCYKDIESGLTWVGMVGIKDPARPEVAASINECTEAGIRVMMITGDSKDTAIAIARDVNIFNSNDNGVPVKAYEGREFFEKFTEEEQIELLKTNNIVFCRTEPSDKQKLIKLLQGLNEIPAMTGDGVNDAPALQQSAIGVAMGITGTEVAKEAADMILADDNFSTIVAAVKEGRRIYANMQAFICFLISCNIGEICAILFATIAGFPEPLNAMHLLWVNLVTDGPPATALGFNPPDPDIMKQRPRPSDEPIMTRWLLIRYCLTGLYVGLATVGVFIGHYMTLGVDLKELGMWSKCGTAWKPPSKLLNGSAGGTTTTTSNMLCENLFQGNGRVLPQTLSLTTLVCMEMLKALSAVSVDSSLFKVGPQSNPWLLVGCAVPFGLHLLVLYSSKLGMPALGESFGVVPLSTDNWITVLQWAAPILLVDEILKFVGRILQRNSLKKEEKNTRDDETGAKI